MEFDMAKARRESMRWLILLTLNKAQPLGAREGLVLSVAQAQFPDATPLELRTHLKYLQSRDLVKIITDPSGPWHAELTRYGVDVAEYTIECEPGIARPPKYWAG